MAWLAGVRMNPVFLFSPSQASEYTFLSENTNFNSIAKVRGLSSTLDGDGAVFLHQKNPYFCNFRCGGVFFLLFFFLAARELLTDRIKGHFLLL